ncbi:hypothetical protein TURU_148710 [Turdus rufiventris]|nr:hypothetical protein TURU_148710 [Turdus rufiventris]
MEVSAQGGIPDGIDGLWLLMGVTTHNGRASVEKNSFGIKIPGEIGSQTGICIFIRDGNELLQEISEFNQEIKEQ